MRESIDYTKALRVFEKFVKRNKIYVENERGMMLRLDKFSPKLYAEFIQGFAKGGYAKRFNKKNNSLGLGASGTTSPVAFRLKEEFFEEYDRAFKKLYSTYEGDEDFITLYFEQTRQPIAKLFKKKSGLGSVSEKIGDFIDS